MATTPVEWLPVLAKRLDDRYPRVSLLRSYASGNPPMPEMGDNVRASWIAFQRKACTNYGGLAVESLANRIVPNGIRVGDSEDNPAVKAARRIWRDNRLDVVVADAIRDSFTTSIGYLVVGSDRGKAIVTRELPEQFIAATDPLRPWKARAALKVWRDLDVEKDYAYVWVTGRGQLFERPSREIVSGKPGPLITRSEGNWVPVGVADIYSGEPPVVILERHGGVGLFEPHIGVIDRINLGKLQRLVTTAMQAYRQRAMKGGLDKVDEDGNEIDWAKVFEPAPGAMWDLPVGVEVWESQQTDIRPLLEGETTDARDFAAVVQTPLTVFVPSGQNQSAEGAAQAAAGQVNQAKNEIARLSVGLAVALVYALRVENVDLGDDTVEVLFTPPDRVSLSEQYAAAAAAKGAGLAKRTIMRDVLGMSPDQIAQDAEDTANEMLSSFVLTGPNGNAGT